MDKARIVDQSWLGGPAAVGANWYRFRGGEVVHHQRVETVCFIWVVRGSGRIVANNQELVLDSSQILRLPWGHEIAYYPSDLNPFHVGTVHIVPWHSLSVPVEARVGVLKGDPLVGVEWRGPGDSSNEVTLTSARTVRGRNLIQLGTFAVNSFLDLAPTESKLRALGQLFVDQALESESRASGSKGIPVSLQLMMEFINSDLGEHWTVAEVSRAGNCSPSTAARLFSRHTGQSLAAWANHQRLLAAADLLRTTSMRVNEVAFELGFQDPLYFSRVFSVAYGVPPSKYFSDELRP
jgi:AraC-like DNA-binding protein